MLKIKSYGKSELALLYFPDAITAKGALSNLNSWIRGNQELREALRRCAMPQMSKFFTPKEVALIVEYLGEP
jgi:hypothetical protein